MADLSSNEQPINYQLPTQRNCAQNRISKTFVHSSTWREHLQHHEQMHFNASWNYLAITHLLCAGSTQGRQHMRTPQNHYLK